MTLSSALYRFNAAHARTDGVRSNDLLYGAWISLLVGHVLAQLFPLYVSLDFHELFRRFVDEHSSGFDACQACDGWLQNNKSCCDLQVRNRGDLSRVGETVVARTCKKTLILCSALDTRHQKG